MTSFPSSSPASTTMDVAFSALQEHQQTPHIGRGAEVSSYLVGVLGKKRTRGLHQGEGALDAPTSSSPRPLIASNEEWHMETRDPAQTPASNALSFSTRLESAATREPLPKRRRLSSGIGGGTSLNNQRLELFSGSDEQKLSKAPPQVVVAESDDNIRVIKSTDKGDENGEVGSSSSPEATMAWLEDVRLQVAECQEEDDLMMARQYLQDALPTATLASSQGICSPSYLSRHFLAELGDLCYELGDCLEAIDYYAAAAKNLKQQEVPFSSSSSPPSQSSSNNLLLLILSYMENISKIYVEVRQYSSALCVFKEMYDMQIEIFGNISAEVASTLCNMGLMHFLLELYTPSLHFYHEAFRISLTRLQAYNQGQPSECNDDDSSSSATAFAINKSVADSLNAMGLLYFKLKRFEDALNAFGFSLSIREKLFGPYYRDVTILWYNLAMVRVEMGDPRRAVPLYEEGLRRERVALGGDHYHPSLSPTLQYLGEIYNHLGEMDDSLLCFQQALEIEKRQAIKSQEGNTNPAAESSGENPRTPTDHWGSVFRLLNVVANIHLMQANIPASMQSFVEAARAASTTRNQDIPLVVAGHMFCHLTRLHPSCASAA